MMSLRDKEALYSTKEEDDATNTSTMAPSSSRQWSSGLKNPRIVRVSRTFGGKDRHSKVCTIKGLRDRRIRLSVPTAIQLYDLQDRLGLGQPSKVIDWLLDTTKLDIDKLPPLPPIPGTFDPFQQSIHMSQGYGASQSSLNPFFDANLIPSRRGGININSESVDINEDPSIVAKLKYWDSSATIRSKQKEIDDDQGTIGEGSSGNNQVLAQNFFPIASSNNNNASILPPSTFLSNHHHPMYNYYHHWEPSNLSLTQFGNNHGLLSSQNAHHHSSNSSSLPSPLALSSGSSSQLFLSPSMASASTHYPHNHASYVSNHPQLENDIRQFNRSPLSSNNNNNNNNNNSNNPFTSIPNYSTSSSDLGLKPFPLSMSHHPQLHQSNDDDDHQQHDKNNHGSWKESSRN